MKKSVLVIGGGIAGLAAARELARNDALKRMQNRGDLFALVLKLKQKLPSPDFLHDAAG